MGDAAPRWPSLTAWPRGVPQTEAEGSAQLNKPESLVLMAMGAGFHRRYVPKAEAGPKRS